MKNFINIDKNMVVNSTIDNVEVKWYSVKNAPFCLHGFCEEEVEKGYYCRLPQSVAEETSEGVNLLSRESAGCRVRFSTNSSYVAIRAKFSVVGRSSHLTLISSAGFDLYEDCEGRSKFIKEFRMLHDMVDSYEQIVYLNGEKMRSLTINFPVHSVVESLEVGVNPSAIVGAPTPYKNVKPMVFYGSSIVHGTGASRPGLTYSATISRRLNIDYRNIGFSGVARGEQSMAKWLATLPTSVFVCDYDHNAPTVEHLKNTHFAFYETYRKINPTTPYIMITRPDFYTMHLDQKEILTRRDIIMESYLKARSLGDENVYFIDGLSFNYEPYTYDLSLDGCHPNDSGFIRMANAISTIIEYILDI